MKRYLLAVLVLINVSLIQTAYAIVPVIDYAALGQLASQLSQLQIETRYIQQALQGLNGNQYQWSNAQGLINNLGAIVSQSNGLAYSASNLNQAFQTAYPGYQAPANFSQQYQNNVTLTLNTLNGILQSQGSNAADFQNENTRLAFLQAQAQSAQGQTQAIQASAQIASEMVSEQQLMRQTLIAQSNAEAVYDAAQVQNAASVHAQLQEVIDAGNTQVPSYGSSGHPLNPPQF